MIGLHQIRSAKLKYKTFVVYSVHCTHQIPTSHITTRWSYVILMTGEDMTQLQSLSVTFTLRISLLDVLGCPYMMSCKISKVFQLKYTVGLNHQ